MLLREENMFQLLVEWRNAMIARGIYILKKPTRAVSS